MTRPFRHKGNPLRLLSDGGIAAWNLIRMPGRFYRGTLPVADEALQEKAAELRRHVTVLSEDIGPRCIPDRPVQLAQAADYLASELAAYGYQVQRIGYDVDGTNCDNIVVEIRGSRQPEQIVVIGAHYDSVPGSPAANDNASAVAAMLVLARKFAGTSTDRTLRFVGFVNEELPYAHTPRMGSWVYARHCRAIREDVTAMISLETIGCYSDKPGSQRYPPLLGKIYPSTGNFIAFVGHTRYARLVRQCVAAFRANEPFPALGGALPDAFADIGRSDHWSFWQEGYPALMVTDTAPFRYPYYHTAEDTVDKLDFERTARVVRGMEHVVADLVRGR